MRLLFENFFIATKSPFNVFDILQQTGFSETLKGPPLASFGFVRSFNMIFLRFENSQ